MILLFCQIFVNISKPESAVYHCALDQVGVAKEECVFIDDKIENIEGADLVGIRGVYLDRGKQDLRELLCEQKLLSNHSVLEEKVE